MGYPITKNIKVPSIFGDKEISLTFNSGLTIFVGPNGSGKTQTMRMLKGNFSDSFQQSQIRYLSSNRMGLLERYRSKTDRGSYDMAHFSLGNQEDKEVKQQIEVASGDFFTMDAQKDVYIKVTERLSTLFNRNMFLKWDDGRLQVFFSKSEDSNPYSIVAEASGIINVVSILAALYDHDIKLLFIDEPEVSLHPQLQAFLLKEIKKVAGNYEDNDKKMIIMATHSTEMMEVRRIMDLTNYVFFSDNGQIPQQISTSAEELKNKKLQDLVGRIGQSYKTAFFSQRPLLVEGVSDSLICKYLDDKFELNLGVAGVQIVPVEGKGQFPATVKLMRLIGKKPIIIADLDAFVDDNDTINLFVCEKEAIDQASLHGHTDMSKFVSEVKNNIQETCKKYGDDLQQKYTTHPYWKHAEDNETAKAKIRAIVATIFNTSDDEIKEWPHNDEWNHLKTQITALFDCLKKVGCFILNKGALESYYVHSSKDTFDGKPSAAIEEIEFLDTQDKPYIEEKYCDILNALKYASKMKHIDETNAIKRELLSELAPIMDIITKDTTTDQINTVIQQIKGTNKSLFQYDIVNIGEDPGIQVNLQSKIMLVSGFPFSIKKGDNVNSIVNTCVKP